MLPFRACCLRWAMAMLSLLLVVVSPTLRAQQAFSSPTAAGDALVDVVVLKR